MGAPPTSQVVPLPTNLPFRLVSKTIGAGAYASVRKAAPRDKPAPILAIKFINKDHAFKTGRLQPKQIELELCLHKQVSGHGNIVRYINHGKDEHWIWLAMELAEGGDLFDKIEADEGVSEDIAHVYFTQLISAINWCHGKGVAHRDIKPENMLLSRAGNLKLADFGLATMFLDPQTGKQKSSSMVCGSPPYIAPEILAAGQKNLKRKSAGDPKAGYFPPHADIWSCAIVLFVLFAGNTPWDSPDRSESWEFNEFIKTNGRPDDELWDKIPSEALSLLRGMLKLDTSERLSLAAVVQHPWHTRQNPHLSADGRLKDPVMTATQMFERMHIDFGAQVPQSQGQGRPDPHAMDVDSLQPAGWARFTSTQPITPTTDLTFEWEQPPRIAAFSASQPSVHDRIDLGNDAAFMMRLYEEPSMSQFAPTSTVPLSLTQRASEFADILPAHSMAHFVSMIPMPSLVSALTTALHRLSIPISPVQDLAMNTAEKKVAIRIKTLDSRQQLLQGNVVVERLREGVQDVRFVKAKGDPLSWRRLFKHVAILCKDVIVKPDI